MQIISLLIPGISWLYSNIASFGNVNPLEPVICSRTAKGESCTRAVLRDDMKAMGFDVSKKFSRWLDKLEKDNLITLRGEEIIPLPYQTKVGD